MAVIEGRELGNGYVYMPNMQWGSGIGDWDPYKLYIPDGSYPQRVYEVDIGIPSKQR